MCTRHVEPVSPGDVRSLIYETWVIVRVRDFTDNVLEGTGGACIDCATCRVGQDVVELATSSGAFPDAFERGSGYDFLYDTGFPRCQRRAHGSRYSS